MAKPDTAELTDDQRAAVFVVIAAYNESTSIEGVVSQLRTQYSNVVVVDDGSDDDTFDVASKCSTYVLRHVLNRGQGAALQTGIEFALRRGAEIIITFDADGQHRFEDIPAMVNPILRGECEICLGSRFLGGAQNIPASRRRMLKLAVLFTRAVNRIKLTDTHNGFRAFSKNAASKINITLDGMAHASELLDQIKASGCSFKEVPVQILYTDYSIQKGQSSRGALRIVVNYFLGRVLR